MPNVTDKDCSNYSALYLLDDLGLAMRRGLACATNQMVEAGDSEHFKLVRIRMERESKDDQGSAVLASTAMPFHLWERWHSEAVT